MVPAYGGMFRPKPPRTWPYVVLVVVVLVLAIGGFFLWRRHVRHAEAFAATGTPCQGGYECHGGLCIRDDQDNKPLATGYCGNPCADDEDCPAGYICQPTRSGTRHACMVGERER